MYEDGATESMCHYLSVPENLVPVNLRNFIINVSLGSQQVGQRTAWKETVLPDVFKGTNCSKKKRGPVDAFLFWDPGGFVDSRSSRMREVFYFLR